MGDVPGELPEEAGLVAVGEAPALEGPALGGCYQGVVPLTDAPYAEGVSEKRAFWLLKMLVLFAKQVCS